MNRRRPAHRLTSALIGAIVTAMGALTAALLSGKDLDTELIAIVALASVGGWLLITALLSSRTPRSGPDEGSWPGASSTADAPGVAWSSDASQPPAEAPLTAAARKAASRAKIDPS